LRLTPIFDTNIFGYVQDGSISQKDWRCLLRHRPGHGWPLSMVTALELLAGVQEAQAERFQGQQAQIRFAIQISKGRILDDPRVLIRRELSGITAPSHDLPDLVPPVIADYMHVVGCAHSLGDLLNARVRVHKLKTKGQGHAGLSGVQPTVVRDLVSGPKDSWKAIVENLANANYPSWREHFQQTGKRLPDDLRKDLEVRLASPPERLKFVEAFMEWLGATPGMTSLAEVAARLDAVLEFTSFVLREFLLRQYNLEKHGSDVYDQFQLHHLAMDRFVLVSEDSDMVARTTRSSQRDRIVSFETFLRTL
jgi:hypothetical protein